MSLQMYHGYIFPLYTPDTYAKTALTCMLTGFARIASICTGCTGKLAGRAQGAYIAVKIRTYAKNTK